METSTAAVVTPSAGPPTTRGGFRGRGMSGPPTRGGFERGRGRGMGRGHYSGMGRGGGPLGLGGPPPPGMMSGRGMRIPRSMGYQGRGFGPRGSQSMRGGRPPLYAQPPKQHTGAENNKTVSPVPSANTSTANTTVTTTDAAAAAPAAVNSTGSSATTAASTTADVTVTANGNGGGPPPMSRGPPRGRGGMSYGRGRGGYNSHSNGMHMGGHAMGGGMGAEHGQMPMRRGGPHRGRGGYAQSMSRSPMHHAHSANTQIAPVPSLKRGAPGGPPGPKRGRYESSGPYSQRPMAPKYHQHVSSIPPQSSYSAPPNHHHQPQSHHGYGAHDQSQAVDPYAQSYSAPAQTTYNGYAQTSGYAAHAQPAPPASTGYAAHHSATEYDQTQYQSQVKVFL